MHGTFNGIPLKKIIALKTTGPTAVVTQTTLTGEPMTYPEFGRTKMATAITLALLLVCIDPGCRTGRESHEMITVSRKDNNTQVVLTTGQELEVALSENPTTGFRWQMKTAGKPILELLDDKFDSPASGVGKGGTRRWRFKAAQKGSAGIEMVYRRASEQDQAPAETFRLAVRVEP